MSMHLRNSRDMMTTEEAGWWVSKTPLEQKLIILSSVLFVLSFCLTISVIVLDNRKPPSCPLTTTVAPPTNDTTSPETEKPTETPKPTEKPETTEKPKPTEKSEPTEKSKPTENPEPTVKALADLKAAPEDSTEFFTEEDSTEFFTEEEPSGRQV